MKIRTRLTPSEAKSLGLTVKQSEPGRNTARYYITPTQRERVFTARGGKMVTVRRVLKGDNIVLEEKKLRHEIEPVPDGFEITKISTNRNTGHQWITMRPQTKPTITPDEIEEIVKNIIGNKVTPVGHGNVERVDVFDRLVFTDAHIGMPTNSNGTSPFDLNWGKDAIMEACNGLAHFAITHKKSGVIYIDDLGDFVDNFGGYTVRREHEMPTEMPTHEIFDLAVKFKVNLVRLLLGQYDTVVMHNVCNDNHAGDFGYVVNSAVKSILEGLYPEKVFVHNIREFMGHYTVGDKAFILSHGKDGKYMKRGMPTKPTVNDIERIQAYIVKNGLQNKIIEFSKGDSHLAVFDYSNPSFIYNNYPSLSPSSEWEQLNFSPGRSGFVFYVYETYGTNVEKYFNIAKQ